MPTPQRPQGQGPKAHPFQNVEDGSHEFVRRGTSSGTTLDVSMFEFLNERLLAIDARFFAMVEYQKELILVRFEAAQEAIKKADEANEKRFASVNEFRGQLNDQATHLATKESVQTVVDNVSGVTNRLSNIEGRFWAFGLVFALFNIILTLGVHFIH